MKKILIFLMINMFTLADDFELRFSTGLLNGVAHELVYKDSAGTKLSELIWNMENVPMASFGIEYRGIKVDLDFNYVTGKSTMDDYDWLINSAEWTHWSNSPTEIESVIKLDLNYEHTINISDFSLGIIAGYKFDYFEWVASGGTYIYSNNNTGDKAKTGTFPDIPGISYEQFFSAPYLGLSGKQKLRLFSGYINFLYSPLVYALDKDIHHLRENGGMVFEGVFEDVSFFELNVRGEININDNFIINLSYDYSKYLTNKGYYSGYFIGTGEEYYGGYGSVGLNNKTSTISLGLTYKF